MEPSYAYLSEGELFVKSPGQPARAVPSAFAEEMQRRMLALQQKSEWKRKGAGASFMAGALTWGQADEPAAAPRAGIVALAKSADGQRLLYAIQTDTVSGIFSYDPHTREELRLYHNNEQRIQALATHPEREEVLCSAIGPTGLGNLALYQTGRGLKELTEGDSLDSACCWRDQDSIVFQSSGIGRDARGLWSATGPASLEQLDLGTGQLTTLHGTREHDFLAPKAATDGTLYFIRRPYRNARRASLGAWLLDIVLVPWRLLRAIASWINFFSMRYTGKPLRRAGTGDEAGPDPRQLLILGNLIDAGKERQSALRKGEKAPAIVPQTWQLLRQRARGEPEVLAKGIIAFDLCPDGAILYSNGSGVFRLGADGQRQLLEETRHAEALVTL